MQKKFKQKEKTYIRLCLAADELKTDVEKVQVVERILAPHSVGMVHYLTRFCPHFSGHSKLLGGLTYKDSEGKWTTRASGGIRQPRETLVNAPQLKYYST